MTQFGHCGHQRARLRETRSQISGESLMARDKRGRDNHPSTAVGARTKSFAVVAGTGGRTYKKSNYLLKS